MSVGTSDTAVTSGGTNVVALLDQRAPTSFYWSLTLLATIGGFLFGCDTANIGSALPFIPYPLGGYAPRGRRGALSILQQWMITVGILAASLVALVILWALRTRMPESPRWLLRHGRIGLGWIMLCFAGIALIAIGFIHQFLPETKNRSVEEITQLFERQAAGDRQAGLTSPRSADAAAA